MFPRQLRASTLRSLLVPRLGSGLGLSTEDAGKTVDHLLRAEQAGKDHHGLVRCRYLLDSGKFGPYDGTSARAPTRVRPGVLAADGTGALGYPVLHRLVESGCLEAGRHGTCLVTGKNVYPSGALGDWARLATARDTGVLIVASSPPRVASPTGARPVVGTNPLCVGIPGDPHPFVLDAATSALTHGDLLLARGTKEPLPPGSAVAPDGEPTTDADLVAPARGRGAIRPEGGSHRFFAAALAIEMLACLGGGLPGSPDPGDHGVFCLFLGESVLAENRDARSSWLLSLAERETRVPGWVSGQRLSELAGRDAVMVSEATYRSLAAVLSPEDLARCVDPEVLPT